MIQENSDKMMKQIELTDDEFNTICFAVSESISSINYRKNYNNSDPIEQERVKNVNRLSSLRKKLKSIN
jgi:hypothetical protein